MIDWSKQHNGVMLCTYEQTRELMPDVMPIIEQVNTEKAIDNYLIDVKVHMLMPNQWPCLPLWHRDFVPRENGVPNMDLMTEDEMYIWVSGPPYTEWQSNLGKDNGWVTFTQRDLHRGVMSTEFRWRGLIRLIPKHFVHPGTKNVGELRRHSQVYLDAGSFTW